jgi:hypothetical protein
VTLINYFELFLSSIALVEFSNLVSRDDFVFAATDEYGWDSDLADESYGFEVFHVETGAFYTDVVNCFQTPVNKDTRHTTRVLCKVLAHFQKIRERAIKDKSFDLLVVVVRLHIHESRNRSHAPTPQDKFLKPVFLCEILNYMSYVMLFFNSQSNIFTSTLTATRKVKSYNRDSNWADFLSYLVGFYSAP